MEQNRFQGRKMEKWVYFAASVFVSFVGIAGLILSYFWGISPAGCAIAGGEPILKGTLLGAFFEVFRGSANLPIAKPSLSGILPLFLYFQIPCLAAMLLISLSLSVACFFKENTKRLFFQNAKLTLFPYLFLFLGNFLYRAIKEPAFNGNFFDLPSLIPAAAILFCFAIASLFEGRKWVRPLILLLSLLSLFAFSIPHTFLLKTLESLSSPLLLCAAGCTVFNFLLSLFCLNAKKGLAFSGLFFLLQLSFSLSLFFVFFDSARDFILGEPLSISLLVACPLSASFFSLFSIRKKKEKTIEPMEEAEEEPEEEPLPSRAAATLEESVPLDRMKSA